MASPHQIEPALVRPRKALLCGYYGEHNLGDDALLEVLLGQLPTGWDPVVTAADQLQVRQQFGVATTDRRHLGSVLRALAGCDALVLGGGSLLQDSTSFRSLIYYAALIGMARWRGLPVLLWGQGLGPLLRHRSRLLVRGLLPLATVISWRDPASAGQAGAWGIPSLLGTDPVWALAPLEWQGRGGPIVLCWRPVRQLDRTGWAPYIEALDRLGAELDRQVLWIPFHRDQDRGLLDVLVARGLVGEALRARSREVMVADPAQAMAEFRRAGLVVAMRLHGLILAALSGSPCAALSYDPKVAAAAAAIGCPCHELQQPVGAELLQGWRGAVDLPPDPARINGQREGSQVHRQVLESLALAG